MPLAALTSPQCQNAIGVGRANRAGFADIGKAYARMAKASVKMGDKSQAIAYLEDAQVLTIGACTPTGASVLCVGCSPQYNTFC